LTVNQNSGADAAYRFTFGRFLFRDMENRDHSAELTMYLGLGDWFQHGSIHSASGEADISTIVDPFDNGFNSVSRQRYLYETGFDSFELNYRVRRRLRRDRIMLEPNGQWVRRLDPGTLFAYSFGLRILDLRDDFNWTSHSLDVGDGLELMRGDLRVSADNNLVGLQFGGEATHQTDRWSIGAKAKGGPYVNFAAVDATHVVVDLIADGNPSTTRRHRSHENELAFVGEVNVAASYFVRQNVSLRVGCELLWIQSVAVAPEQLVINTADPVIRDQGGQLFHGFSIGMDVYW
jgi:hypothetical protein